MYHEQELGVILLFTSIGFIFLGTSLQMWDYYPMNISIILSIIYFVGFFIFACTGWHTFKIFQLDYKISKLHIAKDLGIEIHFNFDKN